jgi:hypothetical protein
MRQHQHTSAYVSIRQHTSAYVSIRQHQHLKNSKTLEVSASKSVVADLSICQHTSAFA